MRLATFLSLALSWHSAVWACGGHGQELKHWSQEELDELERKWGIEVCFFVAQCQLYSERSLLMESPAVGLHWHRIFCTPEVCQVSDDS